MTDVTTPQLDPTASPRPSHRPRLWWRLAAVITAATIGAFCAMGFALAWLLMGLMGTAIEPWEPVTYGAGFLASVTIPFIVAVRLLRRHRAARLWAAGAILVTFAIAGLAGAVILGAW